jgi:putative Ca2+/H+ antiporter (TMEM165/GDT1 family)
MLLIFKGFHPCEIGDVTFLLSVLESAEILPMKKGGSPISLAIALALGIVHNSGEVG